MFSDDYESQSKLVSVLEENYRLVKCEYDVASWSNIETYKSSISTFVFDTFSEGFNTSWLLSRISEQGLLDSVPIAFTTVEVYNAFIELGFEVFACDILPLVFTNEIVLHRLSNLVEMYTLKQQIGNLTQIHSKRLMMQANKLREQTQKMHKLNYDLIELLVAAIESRDVESGQHIKRIRYFAKALLDVVATECPEYNLTEEQVEIISLASAVHDIGKISIPDAIMLKPARLTREEFELMKAHTTKGARLLSMLDGIGDSIYFQYCREICLNHHERWDGKGYPNKLSGDDIPISAQVVSVADCYDALTSERPYKHALSHEEAVNLIKTGACGAFSPQLMKCFDWCVSDFKRIEAEFKNNPLPSDLQNSLYDNMEIATEEFIDFSQLPSISKPILEQYERLIVDSYDMIFESDFINETFTVHKGDWEEMFGYIPMNFREAISQLNNVCHPDDLANFTTKFNIEEFERLAKDGFKKTRVEFRILYKNGFELYVRGFFIFIVDDDKNLTGICAAFNGYESSVAVVDVKPFFLTHDNLTGLMNGDTMRDEVDKVLAESGENNKGICIFINIDSMTDINHTMGYDFGNTVIKNLADKLTDITSSRECITARISGDKFAVFAGNINRRAEVLLLVEEVHKSLRREYRVGSVESVVTVTMGVSRYPEDGENYAQLIDSARHAGEMSKLNGDNMYAFYSASMRNQFANEPFIASLEGVSLGESASPDNYRFIPVFDKKTGALICYDFFPFSLLDDVVPIPSELFYEGMQMIKNTKHLTVLEIKELVTEVDGLLKLSDDVPMFGAFTLFCEEDIPTILQELSDLYNEYPDACSRVCLNFPQTFLRDISWRKLKSFADSVKSFGFALGVFLVCDQYLHMLCLSEGIFDRVIITPEFAEKSFTGAYPPEFLSQLINNLSLYTSTVTIPNKVSESNSSILFSFDCKGFSDYGSVICGVNEMLKHYSVQYSNGIEKARKNKYKNALNPVSFFFELDKTECFILQHNFVTNTVAMTPNIARVLGYRFSDYVEDFVVEYESFIMPGDFEIVRAALLEAKASGGNTFCIAHVKTLNAEEVVYKKAKFCFVPSVDLQGVTYLVHIIVGITHDD